MEFAYQGEVATPSKCGRMDQACAYGAVPVLMEFDADVLHVETVPLKGTLHLVLVDLNAAKDTTTILKALQSAYPRASNEAEQQLQHLLGSFNHDVCRRALQALKDGDCQELGKLMCEAQKEFDARAGPLCPSQFTAPALHRVLGHEALQPLVWGGKGVGSQGDGTAQLLCRGGWEQRRVAEILREQLGVNPMPLTVHGSDDC
uniref:GHMP kinase C-terminal domain-containing protein n=1 Tax=Chlamydomonas euryale TaxID=1486919 RepID=A0A7R9VMY2_9CHLO